MNREKILEIAHDCDLIGNVGTDSAVLRFAERLLADHSEDALEKANYVLTGDPAPPGCVAVAVEVDCECANCQIYDSCVEGVFTLPCTTNETQSGKNVIFISKEAVK